MRSGFGWKNGDALDFEQTPEKFRFAVRIQLLNGAFLSESVTCRSKKPPKVSEVLESNFDKFAELYPTPTGDIYGYLKLYDQELEDYVDLEPEFCSRIRVQPKDRLQLWYNHEKKHPNAVLLSKKEESMEIEETATVPVVSQIHLLIFKDNNFMVEKDVPLTPGLQHPITALIKHISAEYNVLAGPNQYPHKIFGWVTKNLSQNSYIEAHLDDELEVGATYQLHFVEFKYLIKDDLTVYFVLSNSDKGELQLVRVERQNREENRQKQDAFSDKREEDSSKCNHGEIPEEVTLVKSCIFLRVFKNNRVVVDDVFSFEPSTPHTFQDLISYLDENHNLVEKSSVVRTHSYAWILKVVDENKYTEVDLNGVLEDGMYYHVCVVPDHPLIQGDVSAFLKIRCRSSSKKLEFQLFKRESGGTAAHASSDKRVDEDPATSKHEGVSKIAPVESCIFLRVYKEKRAVAERCLSFNPSTPHTFRRLIDRIDADHNVFTKSVSYRQSIYACIFKVVDDQKLIEVDLKGVVDNGMSYHVHLAESKYAIEGGVSAIFKISYGGHENKKHDFELIKTGSACDQKFIYDRASGKLEHFSKKEDQAALSAKREINVQIFKNGKQLRETSMPITWSDCPRFKSLIRILNKKWSIFEGYMYACILKDMGEDQFDEVCDLNKAVEEGATYQIHVANYYSRLVKDVNVTAYFKISSDRDEKLEFEYVNREVLRAKKNENTVSERLVTREEHLPANFVVQSTHVQPEEDAIQFESGELEKIFKTLNVEDEKSRELPTILQDVYLPSKIASDSPKAITMVLLGETGVGKSTLINGMVNYIAYSNLSEAETSKPKYLIPARFLYDGRTILIGEQTANENVQLHGESATQRPKVYEFTENEQLFRIIDVPGIGDSRGVEQDRKNFDNILEEINRHEEINAFCILIPPNGSRITVAMRYCIYELLSNLHKDAARNIVFCFTKARSTFYKGGDTLPILRDYLKNLKSQQDVEIALDEEQNMFYFDNEPFKYLWLKKNGINLDHERKEYDRSFNVSRESTVKLFEYVRNLPPHNTTAMKALTGTRRLILNMVPISAAASKKIRMNKSSLEDQIEKLRCSRHQTKSLQDHLYMDVFDIKTTQLENPRTVCASAKCIEKVPIGDGKSDRFNVLYKQICHDPCRLQSVTPGKYPDSALKDCAVFPKEKCTECGCSWEHHLHIKYLQETSERKAVNKELQKILASKDNQHLSIADVIKSYELQLEQLKDDEELIKKMSAKFSTFLRNNSMSIRNDVYADYLKHTLKMAEQELAVGGSFQKVAELKQSLRAYEQEVDLLMRAENSSGPVTIEDIFELKKELRALAERHGEIGDMLNIAEGVAVTVEPPAAKSPEKPEPKPRKFKKSEDSSVEESSKKTKKKSNGDAESGGKTYNKSMLKNFL